MNSTVKTINELRTIHGNFSDKKISDEDIRTILDSAVKAANSSNRQCYSIIVVSDREKIKQLTEYSGDRLLLFCVDFTRIIDMAEHMKYQFDVNGIIGFITGSVDASLAAQTACIAARSLGIDSLYTQRGFQRRDLSKAYKEIGLPDKYCFPLIGLILGYPAAKPAFKKGRLSDKGVVHWEDYHRLTTQEKDEMISEYDDKTHHLALIPNWQKEGTPHYLDWFYSKWCKNVKADPRSLQDLIKQLGFIS